MVPMMSDKKFGRQNMLWTSILFVFVLLLIAGLIFAIVLAPVVMLSVVLYGLGSAMVIIFLIALYCSIYAAVERVRTEMHTK